MSRPKSTVPQIRTLGFEPSPDQDPEKTPDHSKGLPVKIMAALSMPRLCFSDSMMCAMALPTMGIEVHKASGAFWEQCLTNLFLEACSRDFDFILTLDYDSVFKPIDVYYLAKLMYDTPDAAAIFPLQFRRGTSELLLALPSGDAHPTLDNFREPLLRAKVGHFGLTMIRVEALKMVPHPWLWSQPNKDGLWGPGKKDADIYFWDKLYKAGHKIYCATHCVIGHMNEMITWPGENLAMRHEYVSDYFADGDAPKDILEQMQKRVDEAKKLDTTQGSAVDA